MEDRRLILRGMSIGEKRLLRWKRCPATVAGTDFNPEDGFVVKVVILCSLVPSRSRQEDLPPFSLEVAASSLQLAERVSLGVSKVH